MEYSSYYESDVLAYFDGRPGELALYEAFFRRMCAQFPACSVKVQKSQISFYHRRLFAAASLPVRRKKGLAQDLHPGDLRALPPVGLPPRGRGGGALSQPLDPPRGGLFTRAAGRRPLCLDRGGLPVR